MRKRLSVIVLLSCAGMILSLRLVIGWLTLNPGSADNPLPLFGDVSGACSDYLWSAGSLPYDIPVMLPVSILFFLLIVMCLLAFFSRSRMMYMTVLSISLLLVIYVIAANVAMFASHVVCGNVIAVGALSLSIAVMAVLIITRRRTESPISGSDDHHHERFTAVSMAFCAVLSIAAAVSLYFGVAAWMRLQTAQGDLQRERVRALVKSGRDVRVFPETIISRGGGRDAKVVISVFSDPFCSACISFYEKESAILSRYGKLVRFDHYFLPLDGKCNRAVKGTGHPYSCEAVSFEYAAAKSGTHDSFMRKHVKRLSRIREMFKKNAARDDIAGIYTDRRGNVDFLKAASSVDCANYIKRDIDFAHKNGISRTPTVFIQGRKISSPLTEEYISAALDGFLNSP